MRKKMDIVRYKGREVPVLRDEVIDVEFVPLEEKTSSKGDDYFRKWIVLFLTTALFWAVVFGAAWLNHLMTR